MAFVQKQKVLSKNAQNGLRVWASMYLIKKLGIKLILWDSCPLQLFPLFLRECTEKKWKTQVKQGPPWTRQSHKWWRSMKWRQDLKSKGRGGGGACKWICIKPEEERLCLCIETFCLHVCMEEASLRGYYDNMALKDVSSIHAAATILKIWTMRFTFRASESCIWLADFHVGELFYFMFTGWVWVWVWGVS